MSYKIVLENIADYDTVESLQQLLSRFGAIDWIFIEIDANTQRPWGYAYVGFTQPESATQAAVVSLRETLAIGSDDTSLRIRVVELGPDNYVDKSPLLNSPAQYIFSRSLLRITDATPGSEIILNGVIKARTDENGNGEVANLLPGNYNLSLKSQPPTNFQAKITIESGAPTELSVVPTRKTGPLPLKQYFAESRRRRMPLVLLLAVIILLSIGLGIWSLQQPEPERKLPTAAKPKPTPPAGMVYIPAERFVMGRSDGMDLFEAPAHVAEVKHEFFLDRTEVTNEQYGQFVAATKHQPPPHWQGEQPPAELLKFPVVNVSWQDAADYCRWRSQGDLTCRLPAEDEWELAARGPNSLLYPWGKEWQQGIANADNVNKSIVAVGSQPNNASPYGALDMVGNVWEWTADDLQIYPLSKAKLQPGVKVIRGGAFDSKPAEATGSFRGFVTPNNRNYDRTGFRCACNFKL